MAETIGIEQKAGNERGRFMRKHAGWLLAAAFIASLTGCSGLGQTHAERRHRWRTVFEQDMRALADDIDLVCMTDRPTRLTNVHQR